MGTCVRVHKQIPLARMRSHHHYSSFINTFFGLYFPMCGSYYDDGFDEYNEQIRSEADREQLKNYILLNLL